MDLLKNPFEEEGRSSQNISPCILVIFGASGDLTARKLLPAIYNLAKEGLMPSQFAVVGFARRDKTDESFRKEMYENIQKFSRTKPIDEAFWKSFQEKLFYFRSEFDQDEGYKNLHGYLEDLDRRMGTKGNRLFYLSVQPKFFPSIIEKLSKTGHIYEGKEPFSRVIIEKPFGKDLESAKKLQEDIQKHIREEQIYRIDHYLGKETVQNILVFRFANSIFESIWNHKYIDHVQITVAEELGIGTRGNFFEEEGLLRDIVQNHIMQLLSLVAMEPPANLQADSIRDEKVKVLESIRPFSPSDLREEIIRGQYKKGLINGEKALGYREENNVDPKSTIETFVSLRLFIDNWRWAGVPFYLRGGKRLPKRGTEIALVFKDAPGVLFKDSSPNPPNVLALKIQPDEGISLKVNCKVPGPTSPIQPVKMDFRYGSYFGKAPPEAYERLIRDCIQGDSTLFARTDEVLESWKLLTPVLEHWAKEVPKNFPNYEAGSWGPQEAEEMMQKEKKQWRTL